MSQYRTEFIVPPDRYICLQLPPHLPEGKATITVTIHSSSSLPEAPGPAAGPESEPEDDLDLDRQDIEWWEEFEDDGGCAESTE